MTRVKTKPTKSRMPKAKPKTKSSTKRNNIGLKANLLAFKKLDRKTLVVVALLLAAIGGFVIYRSQADTGYVGYSRVDENDQVNRINQARVNNGLRTLYNADCMVGINEAWAKHLSDANINVPDSGPFTTSDMPGSTVIQSCGITAANAPSYIEQNYVALIAYHCSSPRHPLTDNCSYEGFKILMNSGGHRANILDPRNLYTGVGSYRDSKNRVWISQSFVWCNCLLANRHHGEWRLTSNATVSSPESARGTSATAHRGQTVTFYHDIQNNAPTNNIATSATYSRYVTIQHLSSTGKVLFSAHVMTAAPTIGIGSVDAWVSNTTVPSNATLGDQYCHIVYYSNSDGDGTDSSHSNKACVKID